jgi:hypothetical protein
MTDGPITCKIQSHYWEVNDGSAGHAMTPARRFSYRTQKNPLLAAVLTHVLSYYVTILSQV